MRPALLGAARVGRPFAELQPEHPVEVRQVVEARHRGDVTDPQLAHERIAQQLVRALEPQPAHIGGKRKPSAFQQLLDISLRQAEPAPDCRGAELGIGKAPHDFRNHRLQARRFDAAVDSGASEIAVGIENIGKQFPQMQIGERCNRRGKAVRG
jgi:hypothetical protein